MSRKDMFLAYKRELCAMDGFDDLADPLWTYLSDFNLFTSHEDAEWIPVGCDGISKAIDRWLKKYTEPNSNGISEADRAYLAHLYTPQGQIVTKIMELLDSEEVREDEQQDKR